MNHAPSQIWSFAQTGIAHDIEIRRARQPKTRAESGSAGLFGVDQKLDGIAEAHAGVERHHARGCFFVVGTQAVRAPVGSVERWMSLENEIRLASEPEARVLEVREHRFRGFVRRISRVGRYVWLFRSASLCCRGSVRLLRRRRRNSDDDPEHKEHPVRAELRELAVTPHSSRIVNRSISHHINYS